MLTELAQVYTSCLMLRAVKGRLVWILKLVRVGMVCSKDIGLALRRVGLTAVIADRVRIRQRRRSGKSQV